MGKNKYESSTKVYTEINIKENKAGILSSLNKRDLFIKEVLASLEAQLNNSYSLSETKENILKAKEVFNFLCRYPKPIIAKLVSERIIDEQEIETNKKIFEYLNVSLKPLYIYDPKARYLESSTPDNYFRVWVRCYPLESECETLIQDIKRSFITIESESRNVIFVLSKQVKKFIEKYREDKIIHWNFMSLDIKFPWTNELICKYSNLWDWRYLHENPAINWNFELIEKNLDRVNWSFISSYPYLKWNEVLLEKYKDYLIFSLKGKGGAKLGTNKKGDSFKINDDGKHYYSDLKGSISLSESIEWSEELIDHSKDCWNWKELCANPSIKWTESMIDKYYNKIDWENLSGNPNLPWNYDFILKYYSKWQWIPEANWLYWDNDCRNDYPSISTNPGIFWNEKMLKKWKNKIDFWRIAMVGKITGSAISGFKQEFDRMEKVGLKFYSRSDVADLYRTGWENFALNKNFIISKDNLEFYYLTKTSLTYPVGDFEYADGHYETNDFILLEILKNCNIEGITLDNLIENETRWSKYLINEEFINDSVWKKLLEQLFKSEFRNYFIRYLYQKMEENI